MVLAFGGVGGEGQSYCVHFNFRLHVDSCQRGLSHTRLTIPYNPLVRFLRAVGGLLTCRAPLGLDMAPAWRAGLRPCPRELLATHSVVGGLLFVRRVHFESAIAEGGYPRCVLSHHMLRGAVALFTRRCFTGENSEESIFSQCVCLLASVGLEVAVRPTSLVSFAGETCWRVHCDRFIFSRAHVLWSRSVILAFGYKRVWR